MKKFLFLSLLLSGIQSAFSQQAPAWTRPVSASPDTAYVMAIRVVLDDSSNIYVLSRYSKTVGGQNISKIYLHKFHPDSTLAWSFVYDSASRGQPVPADMILDANGNVYVGGSFYTQTSSQPILLMKITRGGSFAWLRDSCTAFHNGQIDQLSFWSGHIYAKGYSGIFVVNGNGTEQWSVGMAIQGMAVDRSGNTIATVLVSAVTNFFKFDVSGNILFSDSALEADKIAVDADNNYYLLKGYNQYELSKYDSNGVFQWHKSNFPAPPPFGDIYFDVLVDYYNDVLLVGLSDTLYKFSPAGSLIWSKPMAGLDSYIGSSHIAYDNMLAVAGSAPDSTGYNLEIRLYNLIGNVSWTGYYNGFGPGQEFVVDAASDGSGIYGVEVTGDHTTLAKFASPAFTTPDYSLLCVDSVWYDADPQFIHVRVFNGNVSHLNYPSVRIVSALGDTIGNPHNFVNFFAHLGNGYQEYVDTITQAGITDFSTYTFVIMDGFGDTAAVMGWCRPVGIPEIDQNSLQVFPNPAHDHLTVQWHGNVKPYTLELYNSLGSLQRRESVADQSYSLDITNLADGFYILRIANEQGMMQNKFVKLGY